MRIIEWVKRRYDLCPQRLWHFAPIHRVWHRRAYCAQCWREQMTELNTDRSRAWRIEHAGIDTVRSETAAEQAARIAVTRAGVHISQALYSISTTLEQQGRKRR